MTKAKESKKPTIDETRLLLQLHLTEYTALTTRHTYLITLQYGLITVLVIFLTFIFSFWKSIDKSIFLLLTFAGIQACVVIVNNNIYEINNMILYLEKDLRNLIYEVFDNAVDSSHSIGRFHFWRFEYNQTMGRNSFLSRYLEWFFVLGLLIVFVALVIYIYPIHTVYEYGVLSINLLLLAFNIYVILTTFKVRMTFSKLHKESFHNVIPST